MSALPKSPITDTAPDFALDSDFGHRFGNGLGADFEGLPALVHGYDQGDAFNRISGHQMPPPRKPVPGAERKPHRAARSDTTGGAVGSCAALA